VNDPRLTRARALLAREGVEAEVSNEGASGEILAVRATDPDTMAIGEMAERIRALGYRYVTVELDDPLPVDPRNT
jgi:hypothetical protein